MAGFLAGIRVVSLSTGIAGPNAARMLANYGAEVFKVESRAGGLDAFRAYGDNPEASPRFVEVNLNTRSVTINLKRPEGVALLKELAAKCDVVMDNFRPGVLERLGLGPADLHAVRPDLIVVRMPGLGSTGPLSGYGTWGPTLTAYSGLTYLWNHPGQARPVGSQGVYPDYLTGEMVPIAVVAALIERRRSGAGAVIDVAQVDLAAYMLGTAFLDVLVNDRRAQPVGNVSAHMAPHGCYPCAGEDRWCVIAVSSDHQWRTLCDLIAHPALAEDPRFATFVERARNREELDRMISAWTSKTDAFDVMNRLQDAGVPAGVVQSGGDLAADPHLAARGFIETVHHPVLGDMPMAGLPMQFSAGGHEPYQSPPPLGADNAYVVTELLGHDRAELERLELEQIVY
ncbi:MAG: CoA transferase [Solirubrobacteraceae bacterium]|jgi:crotonobetainyl-CoA:carnitine CoA-transferase CaiB-like acyl-CoA transferase